MTPTHRRTATRALRFLAGALLLAAKPALAHPGSGIVVDRDGQIYFIDTGGGVWKVDARGGLTNLGGQRFHWMALDADDRFARAALQNTSAGTVDRVGSRPTV